jgi:phage repressor protein C with HTH and peptisase S24 domain
MELLGFSQRSLAKAIGVEQPTINRLLAGEVKNPRFLHLIAKALQTSIDYLTGETDVAESAVAYARRSFSGLPATTPEDFGMVAIKEIDLDLGAGASYLGERAIAEVERWFPMHWLREFTDAPPDMLRVARVRGTSMKPTIDNGAFVFIDLRRQRINEQDEIWAVGVADIGMVKRIWANADGSYKIKSDNPAVGPETAVDGEMYVLGRVVGGLNKY